MSSMVMQYAPNQIVSHAKSTVNNAYKLVASDLTMYDTLAALVAAGRKPWPGLDAPGMLQYVMARSENGSGADGSPFYIAFHRGTIPAADGTDGIPVSGGGQTATFPGGINTMVWVMPSVTADEIVLIGGW